MGKVNYKRLKGDSSSGSGWSPSHEVSLLRLVERISDDCTVEINDTGTKLKYKPGVVIGGKHLVHDCGLSRSIGYFLEPLILLGLFGKKPLSIRLKGITNDPKDPSVDTFRTTTMHLLKHFGVPLEGLDLKIESRGAPPLGGGEVVLGVPIVPGSLSAANWIDEGMVRRIRGVAFSTRVSPQIGNRMVYAARGIFNSFIPDVHIFIDSKSGPSGGSMSFSLNDIFCPAQSPGYGISLVAETTSGCLISADSAVCYTQEDLDHMNDSEEKPDLLPPEDLGVRVASMLLGEIEQGGVVDSTHQGLVFLLCALCPQDVSKVRFLGVKFVITPEPVTSTVLLKCVGCGLKNLSRKAS
ncbi:unnamed protein product [Spirodela intermedia]|uniref:Uncharacterized protein n=1 Tax=Spirodela intermedia TaxID=51605 RepID=A0A7I8JHM1_SPIIN|nr:unnamed protein product [Spirodela intermedia]CAA6668922.1 unnamed protein product [Spirodela intermedia]